MLKPKAINEDLEKMLVVFNINIKKLSSLCECERAVRGREGGEWGVGSDTTPTPSSVSVVEEPWGRAVVVTRERAGL